MQARRLVVGIAATALLAAGAGFGAAQFIESPADQAAKLEPPKAEPITVEVIKGPVTSTVVTRGDVGFDDATKITIPSGSGGGPAVITGKVPKVGSTMKEGIVIIEVSGRPVIALAGRHPSYRTLQPGSKGADVKQLQQALDRLGYDPGKADGTYDTEVADAVAELYRDLGYDPPDAGSDRTADKKSAEEALKQAKAQLKQAKQKLKEVKAGPKKSERLSAEGEITQAEIQLEQALEAKPRDKAAIASARTRLAVAKERLAELLEQYEGTAEQQDVDDAEDAVDKAREKLDDAKAAAATPLPQNEVVILRELPRRVDEVAVKLGDTVSNETTITVAGTQPQVVATVTAAEAELLKKGMRATLELPDGGKLPAKVIKIEDAEEDGRKITLVPDKVTAKQAADLRGANVKVTIAVGSSDGDVLSVPSSALFATADGSVQVEVMAADGSTRMQAVRTGLTADGQTEVHPVDADGKDVAEGLDTLAEGSQVVVGR